MGRKANQAHERLIRDTTETKVWFKLYKSGTKWLIAGVAAATLGLAGTTISAKANTAEPAVTSTAVATPTDPASTSSVTETPATNTEVPAAATADATAPTTATDTETTPTAETPVASTTETATDQATIADTTDEVNAQAPAVSEAPAAQSTSAVANETPVADATPTEAAQPSATPTQSTPAVAPAPSTPAPAPAPAAPTTTTTTTSSEPASAAVVQPAAVAAPMALAAAGPSVSAVNPNSVDVTALGYGTATYSPLVTNISDVKNEFGTGNNANIWYSDGDQVLRFSANTPAAVAPNAVLTEILTNKEYIQGVTFSATNTRVIDGQVTLTNESVVTMHIPAQTIKTAGKYFMTTGVGGPFLVWTDGTGTRPFSYGWWKEVDLLTGRDVSNDAEEVKSAQISLANSTDTLVVPATDFSADFSRGDFYLQIRGYYMVNPGTIDRMQVLGSEGLFKATTIQLAPTLNPWNPATSQTVTGTGTAPGDKITITSGGKTVTTTVDNNGNWTANLTGFDPSTNIYVVESNTLGDTPGIVATPQTVTAKRDISYVDGTGKVLGSEPTQSLPITRNVTVTNATTPNPTYSAWTPVTANDKFDAVTTPVITGYYTTQATVAAAGVEVVNAASPTTPVKATVNYTALGSWTTNDPTVGNIQYVNDPNNSGAIQTTTVLPYVPNKTPNYNGQPLTPVDPKDLTKGYIAPPPAQLNANTPIEYKINYQDINVYFRDVTDPVSPKPILSYHVVDGVPETLYDMTVINKQQVSVEARGYEFVTSSIPSGGIMVDTDSNATQEFTLDFIRRTETITPDKPGVPGAPVDPDKPDGAKWPAGSDNVSDLSKVITETITYVADDTGDLVAPTHSDQVTFTRSATVDLVTGVITPSTTWTAVDDDTTFDAVTSPVIATYYTVTPVVDAVTGLTVDSQDEVVTVTYQKLGAWVPTDPTYPEVAYPNDPNDPSQILDLTDPEAPVIPYVPGLIPQGPDGENLPQKDPNDRTQGYIPPTPEDPGQPTPITYVNNTQKGVVIYQNVYDPVHPIVLGKVDELSGESGTTSDYRTAPRLAELISQGFVLVTDSYPIDGVVFDNDLDQDQDFIVTVTHGTATITPTTPGKPGEPVDPNNPGGPKWPDGSDDVSALSKVITETITYVAADNPEVAPTHTDQVTFTRDGVVDLITGVVTPSENWTAVDDDTTFDAVDSPVVATYYTVTPVVDAVTGLTVDSPDHVVQVDYQKLAGWVPTDPDYPEVPYPNDPNNPGGVLDPTGPDAPVIPYVPGLIPQGPDGENLPPKDPNDPSQGYIPPTPADPGEATPITYVDNIQKATVTYQDVNDEAHPTTIGDVDEFTGEGGTVSDYRTADRIAALVAQGYVLQNDEYPADGVKFDNDLKQDQAFVVTFIHGTAAVTTETPGKPGELVDPENPGGPKWPAGSDDTTSLTKVVTETVTFTDVDGNPTAPTYTDEVTFTRDGTVDLVTGVVTPNSPWTPVDGDTTFDTVVIPIVPGYFADKDKVPTVTDLTADSPDVTVEVTYKKVGNWTSTEPGGEPIPYPNDPTKPDGILDVTDPAAPVIPYVPGKTPQGPDGKPLTPKDPNDPTQGYLPPIPSDLGEDTLITYVPDPVIGSGTGDGGTTPDGSNTGTTPDGTTPGSAGPETPTPGPVSETPSNDPNQLGPTAPEAPQAGTGIGTGSTPAREPNNQQASPTAVSSPVANPQAPTAGTAQAATDAQAAQQLPQTDDAVSIWRQVGLALLSLLGLVGLTKRRRRDGGDA